MRAALAVAAIVALAAGCRKKAESKAAARPAPMPEALVVSGRAACDDLVAKECACAAAQPDRADLRDRCALDKARPEALALALETAARTDLEPRVVVSAQNSARKIIDACVTDVATLPSLGCR